MATPKPASKSAPKPAPTAAPQAAPAAPALPKQVVTLIQVDLVVNTEDDLRQIVFGLEKSTDDDGEPKWVIHFKLFKRADAATDYGRPRVKLDIVVDKDLHDKAAETAQKGLNTAQAAFLTGPGARAAEDSQKPGGKPADQKLQSTLIKEE